MVTHDYALGHSESELARLTSQSGTLGELTEYLLRLAGIRSGMRILDVGCGPGDVSFIAAGIAGPTGSVVGIDRAPEPLALATSRASAAGLANVSFAVGDAASFIPEAPVDAIVGRLVAMYWPEPGRVLRHLASQVRAGGIVTFQDYDLEAAASLPACPLFDATLDRLCEVFRRAGVATRMGLTLAGIFEDAGLAHPRMRSTTLVERGQESAAYHQVAEITRTILPLMERTGVASASAIDIDTLEDRLRIEATSLGATLVAPALVGTWATVPGH